jgi:hypothetical protein
MSRSKISDLLGKVVRYGYSLQYLCGDSQSSRLLPRGKAVSSLAGKSGREVGMEPAPPKLHL